MKLAVKYTVCFCFMLCSTLLLAQETNRGSQFTVRGSVIESDTKKPIPDVNIEVNGGSYTTTDYGGNFRIEARKGDELTIKHKDFETVYYTIQSNERITVEVQPSIEESKFSKQKAYSRTDPVLFKSLIDSAETNLKKDAKKSIQFIEKALGASNSAKENSDAYEVLGDIYIFWKQYDLAVSNYRVSLQNSETNTVKLKLAAAYKENKNYQESLQTYNHITKKELSNWQLVTLYEGLGDVYLLTATHDASINAYQQGLNVAQKHQISTKITDLNSKIAQAYNVKGETQKAEGYFNKSLKLASNQTKKRAAEEKIKVADFQNNINNYSNEIELRKEALKDIKAIQSTVSIDNSSDLTAQKQNYKIGNAFALKKDYENAIPYLKRSIEEADVKEDLIVQKDATRKLSEVYRESGDFSKALLAYQSYVDLVDKLYTIKEQEISQAARFSKDIIAKQNRILSLESDRALSESKYELNIEQAKLQKLIIYSLIGGVLLLLILN